MATSLARQLDQLRAVAVDAHKTPSQLGPSILATTLTGEQLTFLAKEAFEALCSTAPCLQQFKKTIFGGDQDNIEDDSDEEMDSEDEDQSLEDLLFLLSDHVLSKPAQYLFQYLIVKLKIHVKYPEILFFISLPYYQYEVFNKIVGCLPVKKTTSEHENHPRWVEHFRLACHPATSVGLHRHLACDKGFFNLVSTHMVRLMKVHFPKFGVQEGISYNGMVHCFVTMIVSALNLCNSVSEYQTLDLVRVAFTGLKCHKPEGEAGDSPREEFYSLSMIILSYLLTRVQFKAKVCTRLLKILKKEVSIETLVLLITLYRSQRQNMKEEKLSIVELFLKHTDIVSDLMDNADQKGEEDKQFAKKLQKAMGLLMYDVWDVAPITHLVELLKVNFEAMVKSLLSSELAGVLVTSVTKIHERLIAKNKTVLKKMKKSPAEDLGSIAQTLKGGLLLCHRILNLLKKNYTVEFYKQSKVSHRSDIFVMENEDTLPSTEQVKVKRILYDNEFIKDLMNDHQLLPATWRKSKVHSFGKKVIKGNEADVKNIFSLVDPSFLIRHITPKSLVCLVTRLLLLFEKKPTIIKEILEFLSSSDFQSNKEIKEELEHYNIDIAMLTLPLTFSKHLSNQESILPFLKKLTNMNVDIMPLVSEKEKMKIPDELFQCYVENFDVDYLNALAELFTKCNIMQEPHQFALIAIGGSTCLSKGEYGDRVETTFGNVLSVLSIAVEKMKLAEDPETSKLADNQLYFTVRKKGIVLTTLVERLLSSIKNMAKLILDRDAELRLCIFTLELGCALKVLGHKSAAEMAFEIYEPNEFHPLHLKISSMEGFAAESFIPHHLHDQYFGSAQAHCSKKMSGALNSDKLLIYIPYVLASLMSTSSSIRKNVMKAVKKMTLKGKAKVYSPLIAHLLDKEVEILSSHVNMPDIMLEFGALQDSDVQLTKLLLVAIDSGSLDVLARICPLLTYLVDLESLKKVASFGSHLLASQNSKEASNCLRAIITSFVTSILKHLDDPTCLKFVSECLRAHNLDILHRNLEKTVPLLTLECIHRRLRKHSKEAIPDTLFNLMIDLSATCDTSDVLTMARKIVEILPLLTTKQILDKLDGIWGEKLNKDIKVIGGRFSVRSSKVMDMDRNWKLTLFLLEVALPRIYDDSPTVLLSLLKPLGVLIKEALDQSDQHDNSYHIDLMLSSILELMTKAGPENLTEKSINPELMVRCIRTCYNPNTKATALLILAKSSAANPEYILHNSIPIFTFMGTHFLKIDAKHSFDVACQAIDVIIPHIQSVCLAKSSSKGASKLADTSLTILHTFADASLDMPHRHRVRTFMYKLLVRLGEIEYLWILALLLIRQFDNSKHKKFAPQTTEDKMERLRELFSKFDIKTQIHSVHKLILNLRNDSETLRIVFGGANATRNNPNPEVEKAMGALKVHTMAVLNYLLTSEVFVHQVQGYLQEVEGSLDEKLVVYQKLEEMLVATIVNTDHFGQLVRQGSARKQLVPCCEKILEAVLSLLPMKAFVQLLSSLMIDQRSSVRRKMLEVFNARLQQAHDQFVDENIIQGLLNPLLDLCTDPEIEPNPLNQQMALLCLRSFGKLAAPSFPTTFIPVCKKLVHKGNLANIENQAVKAATLLCLTELYQSMGPHSVPLLNPFVNWMLKLIDNPAIVQEDTVVLNSLILSVQKCLDNFGGFLNPYFKKFIVSSCRLMMINHEREVPQDDDRKSQAIKIRLKHLCTAVSRSVPSQKLIDLGSECYEELLHEPQHCIVAFSTILKENLSQLDKAQALAVSVPCLKLFQSLFKYRKVEKTTSKVDTVEGHFIDTFLTLMLKLSLDDFKPIFYRLFNLSLGGGDHDDIDSLTTMFHITKSVAEKLKSLFSFICETLVQKTTNIFDQYSKDDFSLMRNLSRPSSKKLVNLFQHMLQTLTEVFTHNQVESLLVKNYEDHVNAILSHIEAPLEPDDVGVLHSQILECLGQLAASTDDETQWKYLNYQVLLYIRNDNLQVRLFVLDVIDRFLDKKRENYLTVLPDSVPLLAEALEDDNSRVEANCRKLIKKMETIFGHSVESYFE